ncbi:hypothetical protein C0Q70_17117 [Pomacea canaliculata]|uniref:Uncharacterized protein n=1 Tax=Pomacea canaliculata TaxID=400727 RepID=A0A2T7NRS4_POMCA|nr:hypothetical protein C0Q70_17117 [Pomacea canaliculata]
MNSTVSSATSSHFRQNICCRCHHDTVSRSCDVIIRAGDLDMDFRELGLGFVFVRVLNRNSHTDVDSNSHTDVDSNSHTDVCSNSHTDVDNNSHTDVDNNSHTDVCTNSHTQARQYSRGSFDLGR